MFSGLLGLYSCAGAPDKSSDFILMETPAGDVSGQPMLFADPDGKLWMSWVEPIGDSAHRLLYSSFDGENWADVQEAARGENWFVNWADLPGVIPLPDGSLFAWYLVRNSGNTYGYDIHMRSSTDWINWSGAFSPHHDGTPTQHGFVGAHPHGDGIMAAWLDGRETGSGGHAHGQSEGAMTLRAAQIRKDGSLSKEIAVDEFVCSCCPTDMVRTSEGLLLAYRDRTPDEIRDISVSLYTESSGWSSPATVHHDGWEIRACPVNGPSVAAMDETVVISWYTGADENHTVKAAFSKDGGRTFESPVVLDVNRPIGRAGAILTDSNTALVTWQGYGETGQQIKYAQLTPEGKLVHEGIAAVIPAGTPPMTPKLAHNYENAWLAWVTRTDEGTNKVQLALKQLH